VSFLRAQGHPNAGRYPLATLWAEAALARRRINMELVSQALLTQGAVASLLSQEGGKAFNEMIEGMVNGG